MLLISFGTRPEYIKIKPLLEEFDGKLPYALLFTGQHTSLLENVVTTTDIRRLKIIDGPNRLDSIVGSIMNNDHVFNGISAVMVQGDTTSAFAVGLAAFHRGLKVVHLEAGLRTWDLQNPFPEEFNRQIVSKVTKMHFAPTESSSQNLIQEKCSENHIYVTGNTVIDSLHWVVEKINKDSKRKKSIIEFLSKQSGTLGLKTLHGHKICYIIGC